MMNQQLFGILKHEVFQSEKNIKSNINILTKDISSYVCESTLLWNWINNDVINSKPYKQDLVHDENEMFMERLIFGIAYAQNPNNKEAIERLIANIELNRKKTIKKKNVSFEKRIFGQEYLEKKSKLLQKIALIKEKFENFSTEIFEITDLINQITELAEQDESLKEDYISFIKHEKIQLLCRLNDVCNYVQDPSNKVLEKEEILKK